MALTAAELDALPIGYKVTAPEVAALSGQNRVKGIHPLLNQNPRSVIILCTIEEGEYPDCWKDEDHQDLIYCLEGRFDKAANRKVYNKGIKSNQAVAMSSADTYPVHVFWRPKKGMPFSYAGKYGFVDYDYSNSVHVAFHLRRLGEPPVVTEPVRTVLKATEERSVERALEQLDDQEFAEWVKTVDGSASVQVRDGLVKVRKYQQAVIKGLKEKYGGRCQVCGWSAKDEFGVDVSEAHHIEYFSSSLNNSPSNIAILCPTHHSLVHLTKATFSTTTKEFICAMGKRLHLVLNYHL